MAEETGAGVGWKLVILLIDCPRGHHRRRFLYGRRQYLLKWAGPSVLLAYIIASCSSFIMRSMGRCFLSGTITGSFAVYAHRHMSPFGILPHGHTGLHVDGGRNHLGSTAVGSTSSSGFRRWRSGYRHDCRRTGCVGGWLRCAAW